MDIEVARVVVAAITAAGAVVWLIGLRFLVASSRKRRGGQRDADEDTGLAGGGREGWLCGSTEVDGEPGALASRAASFLAGGSPYAFGPVKILEKADDRVRFEGAGAGLADRPPGLWFRGGELRFVPLRPGRTRVEWAVEPAAMRSLLWLGGASLAAGLVALIVGCWAVDTYLASSPDPAARWQTFQMFQVIHFLWPPFLFGALYRRGANAVAAQVEALANNLPYHAG